MPNASTLYIRCDRPRPLRVALTVVHSSSTRCCTSCTRSRSSSPLRSGRTSVDSPVSRSSRSPTSSNHPGRCVSCSASSSSETSRASGPTRPQPSLPAASSFLTLSGSVRHLLYARITRRDHSCFHSQCTVQSASAVSRHSHRRLPDDPREHRIRFVSHRPECARCTRYDSPAHPMYIA